jgi:hypothetical protein
MFVRTAFVRTVMVGAALIALTGATAAVWLWQADVL